MEAKLTPELPATVPSHRIIIQDTYVMSYFSVILFFKKVKKEPVKLILKIHFI